MSQRSANTKLKGRTLWFDGDSTYPPDSNKLLTVDNPLVEELTDKIRQFNLNSDKPIKVKTENRAFSFEWNIPDEYKNLNVVDYITDKLMTDLSERKFPEHELSERADRVSHELLLYKKHGVLAVLQVLIFVINTLDKQGVVWGVGRGSSVSSYVLYLMGVHDVDSVKYGLSITDFLH